MKQAADIAEAKKKSPRSILRAARVWLIETVSIQEGYCLNHKKLVQE